MPAILKEAAAVFGTRVRRANGQRQLRERARGRSALTRQLRQASKNLVDRQRHSDDARRTDEQFLRPASHVLRGFDNRALSGCAALIASRAIRVARIHDHAAHAALRGAQVRLGYQNRRCNHQVLREDRRSGRRHFARKNREVERAGFFQAARGRRESKSARERRFRESMFHVGYFGLVLAGGSLVSIFGSDDFANPRTDLCLAGT